MSLNTCLSCFNNPDLKSKIQLPERPARVVRFLIPSPGAVFRIGRLLPRVWVSQLLFLPPKVLGEADFADLMNFDPPRYCPVSQNLSYWNHFQNLPMRDKLFFPQWEMLHWRQGFEAERKLNIVRVEPGKQKSHLLGVQKWFHFDLPGNSELNFGHYITIICKVQIF